MNTDVSISKDGIQTSYLRFTSDSATGIVILLIILISYIKHKIIFGYNLYFSFYKTELPEKTALAILLFLIIPILGLTISALSWYLLGWLQQKTSNIIINHRLPGIRTTLERNLFFNWEDFFKFKLIKEQKIVCLVKDWSEKAAIVEKAIIKPTYPSYLDYDHVMGLIVFSRNMLFLYLIYLINYFLSCSSLIHFFAMLIPLTLIIYFLALVTSYRVIQVLAKAYLICKKEPKLRKKNAIEFEDLFKI